MNRSKDEVDELLAIGISLSSQKGDEDKDNNVADDISWVFNDAVTNKENGSDVLETV